MIRLIFTMVAIATIGLLTVGNYGLSWDEPAGISTLKWNYEYVKNHQPMPLEVHKYNGTIFNAVAEIAYQTREIVRRPFSQSDQAAQSFALETDGSAANKNSAEIQNSDREASNQEKYDRNKDREILDRITVKHPLTFLTALLAYASVAGIIRILYGFQYAWIGPIVLTLFPRFWGHSFFNHKDIPFAAVFSLGILAGAYLITQYLEINKEGRVTTKALVISSALFGILAGVAAGIRLGGYVIIAITFIGYLIVRLGQSRKGIYRDLFRVSVYHSLSFLVCSLIVIICYPTSWSNPIQWLLEAGPTISKYPWTGTVLFNGSLYPQGVIPWYYIFVWLFISVPIILQIAFLFGCAVLFAQYAEFSTIQKASATLVVLQVFLLPIVAVLKHSVIYNEIRHFLFIIPGIAVIVTAFIIWLYQHLNHPRIRLAVAAFLIILFSQIWMDMVALHPYEYLYFNRASRLLAGAPKNYETDYWGLSAREAMEWINQYGTPKLPVLIGVDIRSASVFAAPDVKYVRFESSAISSLLNQSQPFYYLAAPIPSYRYQEYFQECQLVHQVVRQDILLTLVRQCPGGTKWRDLPRNG